VEEIFARNAMMVLKREDFVCIEANWTSKPQNLAAVASRLSLGLDSFVFIDDSHFERESMRQLAPDVTTLDMPDSPADRIAWLLEGVVPTHFFSARLTQEDLTKTAQYKSNTMRTELRTRMSEDDFIKSLEIELRFFVNEPDQAGRLAQMCAKTNQFNLTTRRHSLADINYMASSSDYIVISMSYSDKFGDEGVIGLAIVNLADQEIDTFLMSCRVIGRGAEQALMEKIYVLAREKGVRRLGARFIPTKKNNVAKDFLERVGFALSRKSGAEGRNYLKEI
jgi:FkbH-like protein